MRVCDNCVTQVKSYLNILTRFKYRFQRIRSFVFVDIEVQVRPSGTFSSDVCDRYNPSCRKFPLKHCLCTCTVSRFLFLYRRMLNLWAKIFFQLLMHSLTIKSEEYVCQKAIALFQQTYYYHEGNNNRIVKNIQKPDSLIKAHLLYLVYQNTFKMYVKLGIY